MLTTTATASSLVTETFPIERGTLTSTNYLLSFTPGTLSVTQRPLTVTAADVTRRINTPNPVFTLLYANFAAGEDESDLDTAPTATTTAIQSSPAGAYPITPAGGSDANYSFIYANSTLTVTEQMVPVITWPSPLRAITYGTALGAGRLNAVADVPGTFTYSVDGNPVTVATVLSAGSGQSVTASFTPNDTINYVAVSKVAQLDVGKQALTIKADDKAFIRGGAVPTLTATFTGLVNGDTPASLDTPAQLSTTAQSSSAPGAYPITASGATDANYTITFQPGVMTVRSSSPVINALNGRTGGPGSVFLLELEGFGASEQVTISIEGRAVLSLTTDGLGVARFALRFTGALPKLYTVLATGSQQTMAVRTASTTLTISSTAPALTLPPATTACPLPRRRGSGYSCPW